MLNVPTARFRLFEAFGVPVYADHSAAFLLVLLLLINGGGGPLAIVGSLIIAAVAFVSLVGHELGHAFAVRKLGYGSSQIVLGGMGGVCKWYGRPTRGDAIKIALAGPAASLALAAIGLVLFVAFRDLLADQRLLRVGVYALLALNTVWAVFNLLPIWPMDGGRALRSALGYKKSPREATRISLIVSGVVGVSIAAVAFLFNEWIVAVVVAMLLYRNWQEWESLG